MARPPVARNKLDKFGVDALCDEICNKKSLTQIASEQGVSIASLVYWIADVSERSARVRDARALMGKVWDELSEQVMQDASDDFELKKAMALSHHYRWRSKMVAPKEYGDKTAVEHSGKIDFVDLLAMSGIDDRPKEVGPVREDE